MGRILPAAPRLKVAVEVCLASQPASGLANFALGLDADSPSTLAQLASFVQTLYRGTNKISLKDRPVHSI